MEGKYITQIGLVEIDTFDPENKMVRIHIQSGQYVWIPENEYKDWQKETIDVPEGIVHPVYIPEIPAQMEEIVKEYLEESLPIENKVFQTEEPKKKTVKNKNNDSASKK